MNVSWLEILGTIALSLVISIGYSLDIFFAEKKKWFFTRSLVWLLSAVPVKTLFDGLQLSIFYVCLGLGLLLFIIMIKIWHHFYMQRISSKILKTDSFEFWDLIYRGYGAFKKTIDTSIKAKIEANKKEEKTFRALNKELKNTLPQYIQLIYNNIDKPQDAKAYCYFIMEAFVNTFLSKADARFTLREFDETTNSMVSFWSTVQDQLPAPIPLDKKNMIKRSIDIDGPAIYSNNKSYHQKGNGSIECGKYDEYVSACLVKQKCGSPLFSVSIDVRGTKARQRLLALVDSNIFTIVCQAMTLKLQKELNSVTQQTHAA